MQQPLRFKTMSLKKPIFIIGTGRCGSTIFHQMFCHHPQVAFLSGLCQLYPAQPERNRLAMRLMDLPLVQRWARRKFQPAEHYGFWDHHVRGFSMPFRDLRADDVRPNEKARVQQVLESMLTPRRQRLLVKITGWPRIGFLREIFPDALFIHMLRDGRAVTNSLLNTDFWWGWRGPENWRWGPLTAEQQAEWERHDRSFVALAAIQWKIMMDAFEQARTLVPPSQFMEIKYEDFAVDPIAGFGPILEFCGLDFPPRFRAACGRFNVRSANYKWKADLTARQHEILEECLGDYLARYGYEAQGRLVSSA